VRFSFLGISTALGFAKPDDGRPTLHDLSKALNFSVPALNATAWAHWLRRHHDRAKVQKTLDGIVFGERLGFTGKRFKHVARNPSWSPESQNAIAENIQKRLSLGHLLGPFSSPPTQGFRSSRLHTVPKDKTKFRVIHDLSFPRGTSVNDSILASLFPAEYERIDAAIALIRQVGPGALLMRIDWASAFQQIMLSPDDWELCGFVFKGQFFADTRLPFGARSSPGIFCRYSELFQWILQNEFGIRLTCHYADDHFFVTLPNLAPPGQSATEIQEIVLRIARELGIEINPEKCMGPATTLTYLGIELDTVRMEARISEERKAKVLQEVKDMYERAKTTLRQLDTLLGRLIFVCTVVLPGRSFLSRVIALIKVMHKKKLKLICVDSECKLDLRWWLRFLPVYSGTSVFPDQSWTDASSLHIEVDASGWGAGGFSGRSWFQFEWDTSMRKASIAVREMVALILACYAWGSEWQGKRILFRSDNTAVVSAVGKRRVRDPLLMKWIRELHFLEARGNFLVNVSHIAGAHNLLADHLSRNRVASFRTAFLRRFGFPPDNAPMTVNLPATLEEF